jgi:hypothetical protein
MALRIELTPELEDRLQEEALKHGQEAAEYARTLLESLLLPRTKRPFYETASREEWERAFDAWAESHDATRAPLPPEAYSREHIYGPRG